MKRQSFESVNKKANINFKKIFTNPNEDALTLNGSNSDSIIKVNGKMPTDAAKITKDMLAIGIQSICVISRIPFKNP